MGPDTKKMIKALVLFSGGLDSLLAAVLLREQGVQVDLLCFTSIFFGGQAARKAAAEIGLNLREHDISEELLSIVKNPSNGYGKHLNPCIDCHALMIKRAGDIRKKEGYDLIATGEVLGQRPFSQNRGALVRIGKLAGTEILRPLSAKLLPSTAVEAKGVIKRHKLLDIAGRSRERQLQLASQYGLTAYTTPAGGCLLTDSEFSERLLKMLDHWPDCSVNDVASLKHGRIFWLVSAEQPDRKVLLIIGRQETDNEALQKLAKYGDIMLELKEIAGPTALLRGIAKNQKNIEKIQITVPPNLKMSSLGLNEVKKEREMIELASLLTAYYAPKARGRKVEIEYRNIP